MMRNQLGVQEALDKTMDSMTLETQLCTQSQADSTRMDTILVQIQKLVDALRTRQDVVGRDLEEPNKRCDHQRMEINQLKEKSRELQEELIGVTHNTLVISRDVDAKGELLLLQVSFKRAGFDPLDGCSL